VDELRAHIAQAFPGRDVEEAAWDRKPLAEVIPGFKVLVLAPAAAGEPWLYVSLGAWEATRDEATGLEVVLAAPKKDEKHVEALATAAYFHAFYGLEAGKTMKWGRWWVESTCDRVVALAPTPFPTLGPCELPGRRVDFLWLVPITPEEDAHLKKVGCADLEARLLGTRYTNFLRGSVV
jgi:hypothetical protein